MDEKTILILVFGCLGYIASFFAGYSVGKARRLASNSGVRADDGNRITEATERIEDSERRTEDLIGATESISSIIERYRDKAAEDTKLE